MANFVFADGCQLLQRVAVVGERPCQPGKLGPSCRNQTTDTDSVTTWTQSGSSRLLTISVPTLPRFSRLQGWTRAAKYSHSFHLLPPQEGWLNNAFPSVVIHIYHKLKHNVSVWRFSFLTSTLHKVSLNTTGPPAAAGFLLRSCPLWSDLHVEARAEGDSLL